MAAGRTEEEGKKYGRHLRGRHRRIPDRSRLVIPFSCRARVVGLAGESSARYDSTLGVQVTRRDDHEASSPLSPSSISFGV